jgi:hypothetical protein
MVSDVLKAMLLVAYLDRRSVARRSLNGYDCSLLAPMITRSDNPAARTIRSIVADSALYRLARRVGMSSFRAA